MELVHNVQAEQEVLAAILLDNDVIVDISEILSPGDFFSQKHAALYEAFQTLYSQVKPIDTTTLMNLFNSDLSPVGGFGYISELIRSSIKFNIEHAKIVKEKSNARKLQLLLHETLKKIQEESFKETLLQLQEKTLSFDNLEENNYLTDYQVMKETVEVIERNFNNGGAILGYECRIKSLDTAISGFQKKMLHTIAGRPSMGKSALVLNIAQNFSENHRGLFYSMEMNEIQLGVRRLAMKSFLDSTKLRTGNVNDEDWIKITSVMGRISSGKCLTNTKSSVHVNEIHSAAKKMKLQGGIDYIIVDHLGLLDTTGMGPDIRQQTTNIMKRLKTIAKEMDCPVIVLSQLSRAVEQRGNKRPMLSDLKESAGVEENSDVVLLLYRDEYYNKNTDEKNIIEVNVAKQRDGRTGVIKLAWVPQYQIVSDIDKREG